MKKNFLIIYLLLSIFSSVFSQWQPDVRLTVNGAQSYNSGPSQHNIASSGNTNHIAWFDERNGSWNIYYIRSTDAGVTWGAEVRMTTYPANAYNPSIDAYGNMVYLFWDFYRDGNWEIYYCRSTDGGTNWGTETRLTNNPGQSGVPHVHASGTDVHVVWYDDRDGNFEVYYNRSTNQGLNWGTDTRLTNYSGNSVSPSMAVSGSNLHVAWCEDKDGNYEVYYKRSTDAGISWGADTRISSTPNISELTAVGVSGSNVYIVWQDSRDGSNLQIYYRRSTDGGATWGTETRLTNNTSYAAAPNITASGSNVHVTWQDNRDGNFEVYYRRSTDGGSNWGAETRLTNAGGNSLRTFTTVSGTAVHLSFMDERDGNWEIYYKKDPTGNPITSLPEAPNLLLPPNYSIIYTVTPLFDWDSVIIASNYRLQISVDAAFTNLRFDTTGLINSSLLLRNGILTAGTLSYWRVRGINANGSGPWSSEWRFTTASLPYTPNLVSPANGSTGQSITPLLDWDSVLYSNSFRIQVSRNNIFTNIILDSANVLISNLRIPSGRLTPDSIYYWRACGVNAMGQGPWSAIWNFRVSNLPPTPNLIAPPNGSQGQSITPLLDWDSLTTANSYRVQVSRNSSFTIMVLDSSGVINANLRVPAGRLQHDSTYYWRVKGINIAGEGAWSAVWNFRVAYVNINNYSNEIPLKYNLYNNFPNPFNPQTKIRFDIGSGFLPSTRDGNDNVVLKIYDLLGREISTLVNEQLLPGKYEVDFNGSDYASGIYYYSIKTESFSQTKRMVLIK